MFQSFHDALDAVTKEQIYIEMIEAPAFDKAVEFQRKCIDHDWPTYFAVNGEQVVGWCDITPFANPRLAHRGSLGMGVIASHRLRGLGTLLLKSSLVHAERIGCKGLSCMSTRPTSRRFDFIESWDSRPKD